MTYGILKESGFYFCLKSIISKKDLLGVFFVVLNNSRDMSNGGVNSTAVKAIETNF